MIKTIHRDPADFVATGVEAGSPAHLGPVASDADGFIQWVRVEALLADEVRDLLFHRAEASA